MELRDPDRHRFRVHGAAGAPAPAPLRRRSLPGRAPCGPCRGEPADPARPDPQHAIRRAADGHGNSRASPVTPRDGAEPAPRGASRQLSPFLRLDGRQPARRTRRQLPVSAALYERRELPRPARLRFTVQPYRARGIRCRFPDGGRDARARGTRRDRRAYGRIAFDRLLGGRLRPVCELHSGPAR